MFYISNVMYWLSIIVLLGFSKHVVTSQVGNLTLNISSSDIASINISVSTTDGIMNVNNTRTVMTSTSKHTYSNVSFAVALTSSGTSSTKVIIITTTSSTYVLSATRLPVINSTVAFTHVNSSSSHKGIIVVPMKSSTFIGNKTEIQSNVSLSSAPNATSVLIKESLNKTSSIKQNPPILASSRDLGNTTVQIRTTGSISMVQTTSSRNTKNISSATPYVTSLSVTAGDKKVIPSEYSNSTVKKEITSSTYHISSKSTILFTPIMVSKSVIGINHTIKGSEKAVNVSSLMKSSTSSAVLSTTIGSGKGRFVTSSIKVSQTSKSVSPIVNVTHSSSAKMFDSISTRRSLPSLSSSRYSAVLDFTTSTSTVPVEIASISSSKSSYFTRKPLVTTSEISPSTSIQHLPETKVPDTSPASGKLRLTLEGRIGIGVAIGAGIIIIILLIYFAKSKGKLNRYRRYDNTYQIPGFTDVGGMVQLSTIGDSEYEILDATDYTRGDNPLYDVTQNSGTQSPYDNNGYTENGHSENVTSTTTNATNHNNSPI